MNTMLLIGGAVAGVLVLALAGIGYLWYRERRRLKEVEATIAEHEAETDEDSAGILIDDDAPALGGSLFGLLRTWRARAKAKKMARKGYIKWHVIDGTASAPKWVKPEHDGAGVPEYRHDGEPYIFPDEALVTDAVTGARMAVHRKGEPEPVPLQDPGYPTMDGDLLGKIVNMKAESSPPGLLDKFDMDPAQALIYGTIGLVMVAAAWQQFMG